MKRYLLPVIALALAGGCSDKPQPAAKTPAQPITGPVAASPVAITSDSIHVSAAGKESTVCAVYLAEVDRAHAALVAAPTSQDAAAEVQLYAKLATDACN